MEPHEGNLPCSFLWYVLSVSLQGKPWPLCRLLLFCLDPHRAHTHAGFFYLRSGRDLDSCGTCSSLSISLHLQELFVLSTVLDLSKLPRVRVCCLHPNDCALPLSLIHSCHIDDSPLQPISVCLCVIVRTS